MKSRRLESTVLIAIALLVAVVFASLAQTADRPLAAAGIGLQTLAGLFAAVQLWANNASNNLLRRAADQIDSNRWHVVGLLDGRLRSLLIATAWAVAGFFSLRLPGALDPPAYIGWPLTIVIAALALIGAIVFFLALFMCAGAYFLDGEPLPDGEASTGLQARLAANDWIWPFVALAFLIGGVRFQISRLVLAGEAADLPRLLPSLLEGLLAYYFEPGDPRRSARAALRVGD